MFSAKHLQVGELGENIATEFLKNRGFRIITRNYQTNWGEIDIVAIRKDKTLVFVEVKTLASYNKEIRQNETEEESLRPEDNLTQSKLSKLQKSCEYFANRNPNLINDKKGWQLDLITLVIPKTKTNSLSLTNNEKDFVIKYYENIGF